MKKTSLIKVTFLSLLMPTYLYAANVVPKGNGTWSYDAIFNDQGRVVGFQPGLYANDIVNYNSTALPGHKLTQVFSYGGSMEMYCRGSGGSSPNEPCTNQNMMVYYDPGYQSTIAYANVTQAQITPIIDGVIGADELKTFNDLDVASANIFADKVSAIYCADDRVAGVQFDLEPFDISKVGQANFFRRIARDFASPQFGCVNATHPQGRFFSVFTFSGRVIKKMGTIFNRYGNGFVIDSLYDLGSNPAGVVTSPADFGKLVVPEINRMMANAKKFNVKYQFAIPASASAHEFESVDGVPTGFNQIDWVKVAINAIDASGARNDTRFLGIDLWGYKQATWVHGKKFTPTLPSTGVLAYLGSQL